VLVQLDDQTDGVVPILLLTAANGQHVVEANSDIFPNRSIGSMLLVDSPTSITFFVS
jgi:hypothetical protein